MPTKEAFIAGYKQGHTEGRVGQNTPSQVEDSAKMKYQIWKTQDPEEVLCARCKKPVDETNGS
jgi:hypothetical protein